MILMYDSTLLLQGEIKWWSLLVFKGLNIFNIGVNLLLKSAWEVVNNRADGW